MKSRLLATIAITIVWQVADFIFHGKILAAEYAATASLWIPMAEMSQSKMLILSFLLAFTFVFIYCQMVSPKNQQKGIKLGLLVGILVGLGMAGSYLWMPITRTIATVWFITAVVKYTLAGAIAGALVKKDM